MSSPLMQQYHDIKRHHPEALLLFQVGDFFELFFDDAKKASAFLGITLTQRGLSNKEPIPLCGVPVHTLDHYLIKLVRGGFRVAICEQLSGPIPGKIVERGVTQVLTPGTLTDIKLLHDKSASYLAAIFPQQDSYGLVFTELLTGQICLTNILVADQKIFDAELARFLPDEIIIPANKLGTRLEAHLKQAGYVTTLEPVNNGIESESFVAWLQQSGDAALFVEHSSSMRSALYILFTYLKKNNERALGHIKQLSVYNPDDFLMLDAATQRNLELIKNTHDGSSAHTLFAILDGAVTAMGSRTIKKWLMRPLINHDSITARLDVIGFLMSSISLREAIKNNLQQIGDLERVVGRIALGRAHSADYMTLMCALGCLPELAELLARCADYALVHTIQAQLNNFEDLYALLLISINSDTTKEWKIRSGFNAELDRLRVLVDKGAQAMFELEQREQQKTGINSLKIRYNQAHGYGIEITKANLEAVPNHYIRLQTLVNRERFTMQELKDLEYDINRAQTNISEVEKEVFDTIRGEVEKYLAPLKKLAQALADCDALLGLATISYNHNFIRPNFNTQGDIIITEGRHPVVAAQLQHNFIGNDTTLTAQESMWIITGPNMGGKSTYLRQVALIVLMAQIGSFVPARSANLFMVDRIFTRIGAADNVALGKSTFLVEMEETALICNQATSKSLVILDEVGRGTSTYDGLAIAQAVVEYIYTRVQARCLFATHYHELTALSKNYPNIVAYHAASRQTEQGIVLLHKIVHGIADGSFGIEVAKDAHLPLEVIKRAQAIIADLNQAKLVAPRELSTIEHENKLLHDHVRDLTSKLEAHKIITQQLAKLDYDTLSPRQAFDIVWQLKELS